MNCRFWKLEIAPLLNHLERLIKRGKHPTKKSLRVCRDGWYVVWEEEIITKKQYQPLTVHFGCKIYFKIFLSRNTTGRSPQCRLFRHSKKASLLPSASNDHMPSSLKGRRMSLFTIDPLSVSIQTSWGSQGGLRAWGEAKLGQGHSRQGKQAGGKPACPTELLEKSHWIRA